MQEKVIFIHNPHDTESRRLLAELMADLSPELDLAAVQIAVKSGVPVDVAASQFQGRLYVIDFQALTAAGFPVSQVPSVWIEYPDLRINDLGKACTVDDVRGRLGLQRRPRKPA